LNDPQNTHLRPRKKLAAQLKWVFFLATIGTYLTPLVTKRPNYQI
jgi:hypothetical protein